MKKIVILSLTLTLILSFNLFNFSYAQEKVDIYDIQYTTDYYDISKANNDLQSMNTTSQNSTQSTYMFSYSGNFNHLIYTSSSIRVKQGDKIDLRAKQKTNNKDYPNLYVEYVFVNKGDKANDPKDDINVSQFLEFKNTSGIDYSLKTAVLEVGSNAGTGIDAHLRMWNLNNYDGRLTPSPTMIKVTGDVYKQ